MKQTKERQYAYENEMCKAAGLRMSCNACDRLIYEDENWIDEYSENGGYCKECAEETASSNDSLADAEVFFNSHKLTFKGMQAGDYLDKDDFMIFANNYNALKQSNKELIEALENLRQVVMTVNDVNFWTVHKERVAKSYETLQKAKQL